MNLLIIEITKKETLQNKLFMINTKGKGRKSKGQERALGQEKEKGKKRALAHDTPVLA